MNWSFRKIIDYVPMLTLIMVSGNPAVEALAGDAALIGLFLVSALLFVTRRHFLPEGSMMFLLLIAELLILQVALFGEQSLIASISFYMQMLSAFMLVSVMPRFLDYFVRCMFAIAVGSLFFYACFSLTGGEELLRRFAVYSSDAEFSVGVHNFRGFGYDAPRNSGPFWEPGAFAGYLVLALFSMFMLRAREAQSRRVAGVLLLALLTTLSTMGYAALVIVVLVWSAKKLRDRNPRLSIVGLPFVVTAVALLAWQVAVRVPFLSDKISTQFEEATYAAENAEVNRFGNAMYDLSFVEKRPLIGWSANVETRVSEDHNALDFIERQGNALTGSLVRFGFIGWTMFMCCWLLSFLKTTGSWSAAVAGLGVIAIALTGEKYLNYPLIMAFFFLERHHVHVAPYLRWRSRSRSPTVLQSALGLAKWQ